MIIFLLAESVDLILLYPQVLPNEDSIRIWGVLYISDIQPRVVANFVENIEIHQNMKVIISFDNGGWGGSIVWDNVLMELFSRVG